MARVLRRRARIAARGAASDSRVAGARRRARRPTLPASVSATPTGQAMPPGFSASSFEYRALHQYTGRDPRADRSGPARAAAGADPRSATGHPHRRRQHRRHLVADPRDDPARGHLLRAHRGLAADHAGARRRPGAKLILGINLAAGRPAIAAAEGRALMAGDRPPVHRRARDRQRARPVRRFPLVPRPPRHVYSRRGRRLQPGRLHRAVHAVAQRAADRAAGRPGALGPGLDGRARHVHLRRAGARVRHLPPLSPAGLRDRPDLARLSVDPQPARRRSSSGLAARRGAVRPRRPRSRPPVPDRRDELRLLRGRAGVSDTFASALWALDTLFNFASAGVDGVNFHMLPGSHYELFTFARRAAAPGRRSCTPSTTAC